MSTTSIGSVSWEIRGLQDALQASQQKPPWVIEGLLMEQSATLVSAHPHALKSLSWLGACLEAVAKKTAWGHFSTPNVENALFVETEDPAWLVEARIRGFAKGMGLTAADIVPGFHYACIGPFDLLSEEARIRDLIKDHSLNFIVISTLQNLLGGRSWLDQKEMQPIMDMIVRLSRACPIVLLTHSPWDKKQKRAAGTVTQTANFLTTMHYEKVLNRKTDETFVHVNVDSKAGALETDFSLKLEAEGDPSDPGSARAIVYAGEGWPKGIGKDAVVAAVEDDPDASPKEIAERTGLSVRYCQKIMCGPGGRKKGGKK